MQNSLFLLDFLEDCQDIQMICNKAELQVVDRKSPRARSFNFFVVLGFFYDMLAKDKSDSLC